MSAKSLFSTAAVVCLVLVSAAFWMNSAAAAPTTHADSYVFDEPVTVAAETRPVIHADAPVVSVSADSLKAARARADATHDDRRFEIGVIVELPRAASLRWTEVPSAQGPSHWLLTIRSQDAVFVRPHFAVSPRALGYDVYAAGSEDDTAQQIVDRRKNPAEAGLWGPIFWGDSVTLDVVADHAPTNLIVDRLGHGTVDFRFREKVQDCHLDPNCYPEYADEMSAIALIAIGSGWSQWLCTGNLLADTSQSGQPWLLTANHCIGNQNEAESLAAYFRYQSTTCNGSVPSLQSTPVTLGSDYKAGSSGSDYGLVLLQEDPPAGSVALGWTLDPLASHEDITVIHQPAGSWKRIAFGYQAGDWGNKWNVGYTEAVTESGSSGSALLNANKLVVGQLSTGTSYCWYPQGTDQYGKFSKDWTSGASEFLDNGPPPTTTTTTIPGDDDDDDDAGDDDNADDDSDDWHSGDDDDDNWNYDDDAADDDSGDDDDDDTGGCGC